ncbi:MAG: chemotaxis protein CheW [gamma proteobacterium symbiont of Bathyaustriella thionipta]|nr:chemotaxis protein CheW [gamma proteobacterium symbiont of Bathyaustriella thionipta]MCU7949657.1 chemotaxis protein CheW [gamma proteobacterium symbiont of Bathyaustriella thionipta]MCU7954393.1 chemotaxis protein CheW [gamma proteobacterium symbiont of Bathyaustriella thionipta]MCU7956236.1 chemotaxis protein CheW [gamma proteobacterium symbiont of Bathyaustriella thionipta]MCU7966295.1 chemotaxis protein CheW [gamma proteobacterium symbiont of Bathyaustriella thionipta]
MSLEEIVNDLAVTEQDQHLTFDLSEEELAVPVMNIREIIRYGKLTKMPMVPNFIEGVINLRGNVVPVINLAEKFALKGHDSDKRTCIIMEVDIEDESVVMGIVVDKVLQVIEIPDADIEPTPTLGAKIQTNFIKGMARTEDGFIIILDISQVLSADEIAIVTDMHNNKAVEE